MNNKERLEQYRQDKLDQAFNITSVCRSDIAQALAEESDEEGALDENGEPSKKYQDIALFFTDDEMKQLANKLADFMVDEDTYWRPIRDFVADRVKLEEERKQKRRVKA
jgi:hypothetical protein